MKTTRPLEIIYFYIFPTQTKDKGTVYSFVALDDYSQFLFFLGLEDELNELTIVNHIIGFTQNKDFAGHFENKPITLMLPFEKETVPHDLVTDILKLFKGSVVYDPDTVYKNIEPVLKGAFGV
jgi:hypothetical protein